MARKALSILWNAPVRLRSKYEQFRRDRTFVNGITAPKGKCAVIIGSPTYGNYGDSAILLAQTAFLREALPKYHIHEITYSEFYKYRDKLRGAIRQDCPIFCMGGGNMGNQWVREEQIRYDILSDYPHNPVIVFPQTVFFSPKGDRRYTPERSAAVYNSKQSLTLTAREAESLEKMRELYHGVPILSVPDIVLWARMETFGAVKQDRRGILLCRRDDAEQALSDEAWSQIQRAAEGLAPVRATQMDVDGEITKENRKGRVQGKMQEFCAAELVITDRLHGMVFAALTGTPCVVFGNYNHKVRGTYEWIKYLPYIQYANSIEEAEGLLPALLQMKDCLYDNKPLLPYYEKLKEVVTEKCQGSV